MRMIIDIPDEVYKRIKVNSDYDICALMYAIDNGIPYETMTSYLHQDSITKSDTQITGIYG